jgi:hypothetical protein
MLHHRPQEQWRVISGKWRAKTAASGRTVAKKAEGNERSCSAGQPTHPRVASRSREKRLCRPAVRKASGFPAQTASLLPLGSAGRLSLPAEPSGLVTAEALGKAKPFRMAGGRAALGCYLSGLMTVARPFRAHTLS